MRAAALEMPSEIRDLNQHPRGLYVLFATEMWERFSFYSMLSMFTLYLRNAEQGFGWTTARATSLYSSYLTCVYLSPLLGGWLADRKLGYRRSVMIGAIFFMAGHLLLSFRSLPIMYAALGCLVIGNGFFKPNVSTMIGNLYPEGSHLKDRAYTIFYMGISAGAFIAPLVAEFVSRNYGYHPAFVVAGGGMLISVAILWRFQNEVELKVGKNDLRDAPLPEKVRQDLLRWRTTTAKPYQGDRWLRRKTMEEVKRTYIVDEQNRKLAVQIDIDIFNKIEEILENYALVQLMEEQAGEEALGLDEAVAYYQTLEKAD